MTNYANRGMGLEAALEAVHAQYDAHDVASIDKAETGWKVLGYNPKTGQARKVFPKRKPGADFYGTAYGRSIHFDAKEVSTGNRMHFDDRTDDQVQFLLRHGRKGAIVFFLVYLKEIGRCFLVNPETVRIARSTPIGMRGERMCYKASLSLAELEREIECPIVNGCPDYLAAVINAEGRTA